MNHNRSIRSLLLLAVLAVGISPVLAQDAQRRGPRDDASPQERLERLADHLELSDTQRAELEPLLESHHTAMQVIHEDSKALRQRVRDGDLTQEEALAQRGDFEARIQAEREVLAQAAAPILSDQQQAKLFEMIDKRQSRRGDRRGARRGQRDGGS